MNVAEMLRQEGREEGQQAAEIQFLRRLLAQRFGPADAHVEDLLENSSAAERAAWADRVLTAVTVHEVFGAAWDVSSARVAQPAPDPPAAPRS